VGFQVANYGERNPTYLKRTGPDTPDVVLFKGDDQAFALTASYDKGLGTVVELCGSGGIGDPLKAGCEEVAGEVMRSDGEAWDHSVGGGPHNAGFADNRIFEPVVHLVYGISILENTRGGSPEGKA
jgi:hypothetical protein